MTQTFITAPIEIHKEQEENHPLLTPEMKFPAECARASHCPLDLVAVAAKSEPMWLMTDDQQLLFW